MTMEEASRQYGIPMEMLLEYERWGLCGAAKKVMGAWKYDDTDLKRLSLIMTLHEIGFLPDEIEMYMQLLLKGNRTQEIRIRMLDEQRRNTLQEIHRKERQLELLDYLRHQLRKEKSVKDWKNQPSGGAKT